MDDIIHLLSDAVANQIAAGEVVSRPASAVKELIENSIDAGATHIQLVIKDAGRTLIQVIDDGKGMSFNDARLCFERHATSKITKADDLYSIRTKGFRGEALASIAAIAQVELKTKRAEDDMGTLVLIEGTEIKEHSLTTTQDGTSIAVRNIFFNVPARRNFLKSDATEFANIEEEFNRIALIHNDINFTLYHNGKLILQLQSSNFKQRICNIFGNALNDKLFPIENETNFLKIVGFLGKPENAKKRRSEQYLFINHRHVKSSSLNYAIESAYSQVIPDGNHPQYFICIEVDPATIDINISPTKVEVKLQNDRLVFGFLNAAVRKAIGEFSLVPQLDFDYNTELDINSVPEHGELKIPTIQHDPNYNPFKSPSSSSKSNNYTSNYSPKPKGNMQDWDSFLRGIKTTDVTPKTDSAPEKTVLFDNNNELENVEVDTYFILYKKYLLVKFNEKPMLVNIPRANERILYESYLQALREKPMTIQQSLFPETIVLSAAQAELLSEIREEMHNLGYDIEPMSNCQFAINGTPYGDNNNDVKSVIESMLDEYRFNMMTQRDERDKNLALSLARQKRSLMKPLGSLEEVNHFLQKLFACLFPTLTPSNKKIYEYLSEESLEKML